MSDKPKRRGRPPGIPSPALQGNKHAAKANSRDLALQKIRVNADEMDLIQKAIAAQGQPGATWMREVLLKAAKRAVKA